jgi:hypothetical protein
VITLKAVMLACSAAYACLNFHLVARLFSRRVAWIATAFLIAGPPSLVVWTLSGSADIVMTLLAGASLLLGFTAWQRTGSRAGLMLAAASLGFGLWIQQYILYYVAALAVASIDWSPEGRARLRALAWGADLPPSMRIAIRFVAAAGLSTSHSASWPSSAWGLPSPVRRARHRRGPAENVVDRGRPPVDRSGRVDIGGWCARTWPRGLRRLWRSWPAGRPRSQDDCCRTSRGAEGAHGPGPASHRSSGIHPRALPVLFGFRSPATEWLAVPASAAVIIVAAVAISARADCRLPCLRGS